MAVEFQLGRSINEKVRSSRGIYRDIQLHGSPEGESFGDFALSELLFPKQRDDVECRNLQLVARPVSLGSGTQGIGGTMRPFRQSLL